MKHSLLHSSFLLASLCVLLGSASPLLAYPMYVVYNDSTIGLYDSETGEVVNATFITGLNTPRFIACSGNILYVASEYGEKVSTYNATSGALINDNFITGLNRPAGIAVDGNDLLITIYGHNGNVGTTVQKHNAGTGALIDANFVPGLNSPQAIVVSGENLFVANYWGNSVGKYNALTGATVNASFVSGIANPKGLAVKGNLLYVTIGSYYGDDTVRTYDIATGASINNAFITNAGSANCLQIIGNTLYVAQSEHGRIAKFDATTGALIDAEWITGVTDGAFAIAYSAPRITSQPQSLTVYAGQEASFTVSATGTDVLAYQWRKNGVDIANATGSTFTLSNVNYRDAGDYVVEVTDGLSPVDSGTARLTVISPAPNVSITPGDTQVEAGQNLTFTATVNAGIPPFTYQWRKDGKPIAKATSDTLSLTNLQPKQAGVYDVVVKNAFGVAVSNATRLSFAPPASIVKAPQNNDVDSGGTAVFTVDVPGATAWQWLKNDVPIKGAISSTLTVEDVDASDAGLYSVIVTTPDGKVTTVPAQLCLNDSGLLIYKLAGTGKTYEGAVSAKAALSGYLVLDRAGQRGGLILGGKNGNLKIHRVQLHEDLHTQSTGPVPKTQTVVSEMLADELALWLNGTDSLLKINKTDMAVGPVALKGFANSIDAGSTLQLETVNLTLMLDAANSATARLFQETVEQALARISQDLQAKGSALVE